MSSLEGYNILTMIMGKAFSTTVRLPFDSERTVRIGPKYFCSGLDLSKRFSDFFEISKRNILVSGTIASMADFLNNIYNIKVFMAEYIDDGRKGTATFEISFEI